MKIIFLLAIDHGGSPLQVGLERGLLEIGHQVEYFHPGSQGDLLVVFNMVAHQPHYRYPEFPEWKGAVALVDSAEYGYFKRLPSEAPKYANTFSPASLAHESKNKVEQLRLRHFLEGRSFPYFIREHSIYVNYPGSYYPVDYSLYALSLCRDRPCRETYLKRPTDIFVSWGGSHPFRAHITEALRRCPGNNVIRLLDDATVPRLGQSEYFSHTSAARLSCSYDGYGSGSFRMTEVLVRTLLLQGPLLIRTRAPLLNGDTCVAYDVKHDGETFVSTDIESKVRQALADPETSFAIYERGYDHCMTRLTEKATAAYLLETVEKHDWSRPTPLDLA